MVSYGGLEEHLLGHYKTDSILEVKNFRLGDARHQRQLFSQAIGTQFKTFLATQPDKLVFVSIVHMRNCFTVT